MDGDLIMSVEKEGGNHGIAGGARVFKYLRDEEPEWVQKVLVLCQMATHKRVILTQGGDCFWLCDLPRSCVP